MSHATLSYLACGWQENVFMTDKKGITRKHIPSVVGTGLIALDIVTNNHQNTPLHFWSGGSCGNVLIILAYLGWHSYPVARLGSDNAAKTITNDMRKHGVNLRHVFYDQDVHTPIILQKILTTPDGNPTHRFYWVCPNCGNWLPRYRPFLLREIQSLKQDLPQMNCFHFDRVSAAAFYLAEKARDQGALVVFEPPNIREDKEFQRAYDICDILKYSNGHSKYSAEVAFKSNAKLVIETLGVEGLRYRVRRNGKCEDWKLLPAFRVMNLKDAAGAGDWCTAGIIDMLSNKEGNNGHEEISDENIVKALRYGQALGALNCAFEGARGVMYSLNKAQFNNDLELILERNEANISYKDIFTQKHTGVMKRICPACKPGKKEYYQKK